MSNRLQELAGQALDKIVPGTWTFLSYEEVQKLQMYFAELNVRECARVSATKAGTFDKDSFVAQRIKEHFGVE